IAASLLAPSNRFEAGDALAPERLHCICLQLVVTGKAFVQTNNAFRFHVGDGADQIQCEFVLQADHQSVFRDGINGFSCEYLLFYRRRERKTALEKEFIKNIVSRPALSDVIDMKLKLLFQRLGFMIELRFPCRKVVLGKLED